MPNWWPFSTDQTIGLVVGIPGTIAAIIAAYYARRGYSFGKRAAKAQEQYRNYDVQPRLEVPFTALSDTGPIVVNVRNVGGPAPTFMWVGHDDTRVAVSTGSIGHRSDSLGFRASLIGESTYRAGMGTILLVAEDVQGRWWDCRSGLLLPMPLKEYLKQRMDQVGLSHLAEQVILQIPRKMPPESLHFGE
jgi:hypothetical protein